MTIEHNLTSLALIDTQLHAANLAWAEAQAAVNDATRCHLISLDERSSTAHQQAIEAMHAALARDQALHRAQTLTNEHEAVVAAIVAQLADRVQP